MRELLKRLLDGWRNIMERWEAALDGAYGVDDDLTPADGDDSVVYVYALPDGAYPQHLTALGYVRVRPESPRQPSQMPSQQHRQRLPVAAHVVTPETPTAIVPVCSARCPDCELEALARRHYTPRPGCDNWRICDHHRQLNHVDLMLSEMGRWN